MPDTDPLRAIVRRLSRCASWDQARGILASCLPEPEAEPEPELEDAPEPEFEDAERLGSPDSVHKAL